MGSNYCVTLAAVCVRTGRAGWPMPGRQIGVRERWRRDGRAYCLRAGCCPAATAVALDRGDGSAGPRSISLALAPAAGARSPTARALNLDLAPSGRRAERFGWAGSGLLFAMADGSAGGAGRRDTGSQRGHIVIVGTGTGTGTGPGPWGSSAHRQHWRLAMTPGLHGRTSRREWYCNGDDARLLKRASDLCGAHVMTAPGR